MLRLFKTTIDTVKLALLMVKLARKVYSNSAVRAITIVSKKGKK